MSRFGTSRGWMTLAFIVATGVSFAVFIWQLSTLDPGPACGTILGAVRAAGDAEFKLSQECSTIVLRLLGMKNTAIIISGAINGVMTVMLAVALFGVNFHGRAFGAEASVSNDDREALREGDTVRMEKAEVGEGQIPPQPSPDASGESK